MEIYSSEQEQVEAIKKWWDENGKSTLVTIALMLVVMGGWKWWQGQQHAAAELASLQYQVVLDSIQSNPEQALEQGRVLLAAYPNTAYADLTSLLLARAAVNKGDLDAAVAQLRRVAEGAAEPELKALATVRLARVLLAQGKGEEAKSLLDALDDNQLPALQKEVLGDVLLAAGDRRGARTAYANALEGLRDNPTKSELLMMKIDELADVKGDMS